MQQNDLKKDSNTTARNGKFHCCDNHVLLSENVSNLLKKDEMIERRCERCDECDKCDKCDECDE